MFGYVWIYSSEILLGGLAKPTLHDSIKDESLWLPTTSLTKILVLTHRNVPEKYVPYNPKTFTVQSCEKYAIRYIALANQNAVVSFKI